MIWLHFVGGFYTPQKFIAEARKCGVSRRVAPNIAKAMAFGDVVQLLVWNHGQPLHFADFVISGISMDARISTPLTAQLSQKGQARLVSPGGNTVIRECGSYVVGPTYEVDAALSEVVERAEQIATQLGIKPNYMITGRLSKVYHPPKPINPVPKFSRGFIKTDKPLHDEHDQTVQGVIGYDQRTRKQRDNLNGRLPGF